MRHEEIRWNPALEEWFCIRCGRTSDHVSEEPARKEIDAFECMILSVEDMNRRALKIRENLALLYQEKAAFSFPTPADDPAEYQVEELEAWEKLNQNIRLLETELAAITDQS